MFFDGFIFKGDLFRSPFFNVFNVAKDAYQKDFEGNIL